MVLLPPQTLAPKQDGGGRLHHWEFNSANSRNREIMEWYATIGANIFGRTWYDHSVLNWGAYGPTGAAREPTVIVSRSVHRARLAKTL